MLMSCARTLVLWSLLSTSAIPVAAQTQTEAGTKSFDRALQQTQQNVDAARASQRRVNQLDDDAANLLQRYRTALLETQRAKQYAQQIEELASAQAESQQALERQLSSIDATERELLPLMLRMLSTLDQFVARDLPFLHDERRQRISLLKGVMIDPTVGLGEKYRRVLEAYQIEDDYGRILGVERSEKDGQIVDLLRVGRTALFALSVDGQSARQWNARTQQWQALPREHIAELQQALKIARGAGAADLLLLPAPTARSQQ